jgi:hypothetical protein
MFDLYFLAERSGVHEFLRPIKSLKNCPIVGDTIVYEDNHYKVADRKIDYSEMKITLLCYQNLFINKDLH